METSALKIRVWVEGAIFAALAMVLSFIPTSIGSSFSVSLGMIPLTIYALKRGPVAGLFAGLIWGFLHFATGQVYFLTVNQVLIEYIVAFTFAGLAGLFSTQFRHVTSSKSRRKIIVLATLVGAIARYFWHFVAGVIFWGEYALWGMSPVIFSLLMNTVSCLATAFVTMMILVWIDKMSPQIFD